MSANIKVEKPDDEVKRSRSDYETNVNVNADDVKILSPPKKVPELIVSIDDVEPPFPVQISSSGPYTGLDKENYVINQMSEEVDVQVAGPSNSNKRQKLMTNNNIETSSTCNYGIVTRRSTRSINNSRLIHDEEHIQSIRNRKTNSRDSVKIVKNGKIMFKSKNQEELNKKIESLAKLPDTSTVKTIDINSNPEDNLFLGYKQFKTLCSMSFPQLEKIHIGLNFHENITAKMFEDFLVKIGENLSYFHVTGTGGYIGLKKEEIIIRIPSLPKLEHFAFQSIYSFDTKNEVIDPVKVQIVEENGVELVVVLEDDDENENPTVEAQKTPSNELFKITIFLPKLKSLKEIILGNYIKVITSDPLKSPFEEFSFEFFKQLEVFRVGSPWNEIIHFLPAKYYKVVLKEIQFPDLLKVPFVLSKIAEIFPKLETVHLNLPSTFVLKEFLQIFSKLSIQHIYLNTSFLFKETVEKILCGLYNEGEEERKITWFGNHGNFDGFEESEKELLEKKKKGKKSSKKVFSLKSLKSLTYLKFWHTQRTIYFSKFNEKIGFIDYSNACPFPGDNLVLKFIQELEMIKNFGGFSFPSLNRKLHKYLKNKFFKVTDRFDGYYPKILKVNKIDADAGLNVKVEVKQENHNS